MSADATADSPLIPLAVTHGDRPPIGRTGYGATGQPLSRRLSFSRRRAIPPRRREPSHAEFSGERLRKVVAQNNGPDEPGDFEIHDFINEKTRSHVLRARFERDLGGSAGQASYMAKLYLVLLLVGVGAGIIATVLDVAVDWLSDLKFGFCRKAWYLSRSVCCRSSANHGQCNEFLPWSDTLVDIYPSLARFSSTSIAFSMYVTVGVIFVTVAAFLVKTYAPYAAGSGVPEVKTVLSGVEMKGYLSLNAMIVKAVGLALSVATGLNLGKEGPFVHLASALASVIVSHIDEFKNDFNLMLEFVTAGTAAGVSVAFNAPIGGVLFAFEEAATYFPKNVLWRSFFASATAALTLKFFRQFVHGRSVMFEVDHTLKWHWFEMVVFFFIGALGGVVGVIFIHFNVIYSRFRLSSQRVKRSPILEAIFLVILTAVLSYFFDFLRLSNSQIINTLFRECSDVIQYQAVRASIICASGPQLWPMFVVLVWGAVSKLFLTTLTFGSRVPAGLFVPSLAIGACIGRAVGEATNQLHISFPAWLVFRECTEASVCVQPSIYAIVGAASALAGVTQVSVSLVVIMFELTGGLSHLLPTMLGILAAKLVCTWLEKDGIYDYHILLKRYPFLNQGSKFPNDVYAQKIMRHNLLCIPETTTVGYLRSVIDDSNNFYGWPIVRTEADMMLAGNIVRAELLRALQDAEENVTGLRSDTTVNFAGDLNSFERNSVVSLDESRNLVLNFSAYRDRYMCQVGPETPISEVYECFADLGVHMCFVTRHGKLLGLVSKKNIMAFHDIFEDLPNRYFPTKL